MSLGFWFRPFAHPRCSDVEDDELRLALVARLPRGFLAEYHETRLSKAEKESERRQAR